MFDAALPQPPEERSLCGLTLIPQSIVYKAPLFALLVRDAPSRAQVGLVSQHHKEFSLLTIGSLRNHPGGHLVHDIQGIV